MRYLVVANQTLGDGDLLRVMVDADRRTVASFHLLVPATPQAAFQAAGGAADASSADDRLAAALARFRAAGLGVTGEISGIDPWDGISTVMARDGYDRVIIATLPRTGSRWLRMDLPHRISRRWHVLVEWVRVAEGGGKAASVATIRPAAPRARV